MRHETELALDASPASVPRARQLLREQPDLPPSVRDDAELVVAELVSNACLHGRPPVLLRVAVADGAVRIEVTDRGEALPVQPRVNAEAMTGRGFALVTALARHTGVESLPEGGKTVWAELSEEAATGAASSAVTYLDTELDDLLAGWDDALAGEGDGSSATTPSSATIRPSATTPSSATGTDATAGPGGEAVAAPFGSVGLPGATGRLLHTIELGDVPTELLLDAKSHIDDIVRELKLVAGRASSEGAALAPSLAALVRAVTEDFALARTEIKRQALQAAARGEAVTHLTLHLPPSAAAAGQRYLDALDEIDRQSRAARMLTPAPRRSHLVFRRWYIQALVDQLHALAAGKVPYPPVPLPVVLAEEVDELAALLDTQTRLRLLQGITRELTEARTTQQMADIVVTALLTHDAVVSARVLLRTGPDVLTSLAYGGDPPVAGERYPQVPLSGNLPVAYVVRTGQALHARSVAELYDDFPSLERADVPLTERSMHIAPLRLGDRVLGAVALAFRMGAIDYEAQRDFTTAVADGLAQSVERALADDRVESDRLARQLAVEAAGVGTYVWELATGQLSWDEQLVSIFGIDQTQAPSRIEDFWRFVHPGDAERVAGELQGLMGQPDPFEFEYRSVLPNGDARWYTTRGRVVADADNVPVRVIGAVQDTTARRESDARVARAMDALATAFFFLDRDWRFTFLNSEAGRVLGRSRDELIGKVVWDEFPAAVGSDFEVNYRRAAETGEPVTFDAYYPEPLNAWYEIRAWPSPDGLSVYFLDVTDRRRAQERAQRAIDRAAILAQVSEALARTMEPEEAMRSLAAIVVPELADWVVVTLVGDDQHAGTRRGLGTTLGWHPNPVLREDADRYAQIRLEEMTEAGLVVRAIELGEGQIVQQASMDVLRPMFEPGSEPVQLLEKLGTWAIAVLPLVGQEHPVGLLSVVNTRERGAFSDEDLGLLRDIAARAGLVLDRARLYRQQRRVAEGLQRSLLRPPLAAPGVNVAVRYVPAAEAAQVGGDWYDTFTMDDRTMLVIGDVMGHDLMAAAAMGEARTLLRTLAAQDRGPARTLDDAEDVMAALEVDTLATVIVGCLEPVTPGSPPGTRFRFSNAGHPPPLVISPAGEVRVLDSEDVSPLLGTGRTTHVDTVAELPAGSTLLLYTDGLVERRGQSIDDGTARLVEVVRKLAGAPLDEVCDEVLARLLPERPEDDVALLAVRV